MVQDAVEEAVAAAERAMDDPDLAETPEFLGGLYNLVMWRESGEQTAVWH